MKLELKRRFFEDVCTIGELYVDGVFEAYSLEDIVRPNGAPKIYGETAIPCGTYRLVLTKSVKFGRVLPLLVGVPGFRGIRIHAGNTAIDTKGCILVGRAIGQDRRSILYSRDAFAALYKLLEEAVREGDEVDITITEEPWKAVP